MGILEEARRQANASRQAAEEAKNQEEHARREREQAEQRRQQALKQQQELDQKQALSKFRALNPQTLLQRLRSEVWHCGQIFSFSDRQFEDYGCFNIVGIQKLEGVMLYYRQVSPSYHNKDKSTPSGWGVRSELNGSESAKMDLRDVTTETTRYPVDFAYIALYKTPTNYSRDSKSEAPYQIEVCDGYTTYDIQEERRGFLGRDRHSMSGHSSRETIYQSFDVNTITAQDILSFFINSTKTRIQGRYGHDFGHLRIK